MKLLVVPGFPTDATSLYRSMGPLAALRKSTGRLGAFRDCPDGFDYRLAEKVNWAIIGEVDAVFLQRPYKGVHVTIAELARAMGRPVWVDYDDDLFAVPLDNPSHRLYELENTRRNVAKLASIADVVTVSTAALEQRFRKLNGDVRIVPNAWNRELFGDMVEAPGHLPHVMWRGSHTHQQDMLDYAAQIVDVAERFERWSFTFIGWTPFMVVRYMRGEQANVVDHLDPIDYHAFIRKIHPSICIVPLSDNEFNKAKSNIAWLEATSAGAVTLAPHMPEWQRPGVVTYSGPDEFRDRLSKIIEVGPEGRAKLWAASKRYIDANLILDKVNEQRKAVVEHLARLSRNEKWREHAIARRGVAIETERAGPVASGEALGAEGRPAGEGAVAAVVDDPAND